MTALGKVAMKHVGVTLVTATTALALAAAPAATAAPVEPDRPGLQERLDDVVAAGAVGALAVVRDGHRGWRGNSGVAELGTTRAVPVHGRFRIGSITKTFVATVVLQLVGEGWLRLDDPVEKWLPGVVPDGDRITVRQLLNHTSGLYDYRRTLALPPSQEFLDNRWRTWTAAEQIERAVAHPPTFEPPGSAFAYSNTNYLVLGQIIERVTGRSYSKEIERRIIRPLRLHQTTLPGTTPWIRGPHPHGYAPVEDDGGGIRIVDFTEMNPSLFGAGGEMISSARDLQRFFAALLGGRLLDRPTARRDEDARGRRRELRARPGLAGHRVRGPRLRQRRRRAGRTSPGRSPRRTRTGRPRSPSRPTSAVTPTTDVAVDAFLDQAFCE